MWFIYMVLGIDGLLCLIAITQKAKSGVLAGTLFGALWNIVGLILTATDTTKWVGLPAMAVFAILMFFTCTSNNKDVTMQVKLTGVVVVVLNTIAIILSFV